FVDHKDGLQRHHTRRRSLSLGDEVRVCRAHLSLGVAGREGSINRLPREVTLRMKKLLLSVALFLGLAASAVAEPMYLPNFVTSADFNLPTTLFTVSNASDTARIVRANVYSKTGVLSAIFNVDLPPRATVSVNLRDTLNGATPICKGHFLTANLKGLVGSDGM